MNLRIGFIGLGNIGLPMAQRIAAAGLQPAVFDLAAERVAVAVAGGAVAADSAAAVAAASEVIGICVRDDADVVATLTGPRGVLESARRGSLVAIHSTVQRRTVLELSETSKRHGVTLIDACVAGGAVGAAEGSLTVMVGGPAEAVARAKPMLDCFAKTIVHSGDLGSGCVAKICNNVMQYIAWQAAREALLLAQAAGLSVEALEESTRASGVMGESTARFLGLHKRSPEQRRSPPFQSMMQNFLRIAEKDLHAAQALGEEHGLDLPSTTAALPLLARMYGLDESSRDKEKS